MPRLNINHLIYSNWKLTCCILKGDERGSAMQDVLFRFGSWCYIDSIEHVPLLALEDLPYIIPALWVQHSKTKFLCDVRWLPCNNHFMAALVDAPEFQL